VHGDFGPNTLLDPAVHEVTAAVDWECVHAGDPLEDLAWSERIVRIHHPAHVSALSVFFDEYGHRPAWTACQQMVFPQCRAHLDVSERGQPGGESVHQWRYRLQVTES
jgi:hypothetical protein